MRDKTAAKEMRFAASKYQAGDMGSLVATASHATTTCALPPKIVVGTLKQIDTHVLRTALGKISGMKHI